MSVPPENRGVLGAPPVQYIVPAGKVFTLNYIYLTTLPAPPYSVGLEVRVDSNVVDRDTLSWTEFHALRGASIGHQT